MLNQKANQMKLESKMKFINFGITFTIYLAGVAMGLAISPLFN